MLESEINRIAKDMVTDHLSDLLSTKEVCITLRELYKVEDQYFDPIHVKIKAIVKQLQEHECLRLK